MRVLVISALLACLALPVGAETILATSRVTAVTVYPQGALVTREVRFQAGAGTHEVLVTDLPAGMLPDLIRFAPAEGLLLGAFSLRTDRLPPREEALSPAQTLALAEVDRLEVAERDAVAAVKGVQARTEAAEAQVAYLRGIGGQMPETATPDGLRAIGQMISAEVLAARAASLSAEAELWPLEKTLTDVQEDLAQARAAYDVLPGRAGDYAALSVAVTSETAGGRLLTLTHYVSEASWRPVYDLNLSRRGEASLTIRRGVYVTQYSGEDWAGVALTLSTAQPSEQAEPTALYPELRRIEPEAQLKRKDAIASDSAEMAAPMAEASMVAEAGVLGDFVVYRYPVPVDVAAGVEDLRLALDELTLTPEVEARAVPRADRTAFVMARFTNTTGEILLPGNAYLTRDGVLVGGAWLDRVAPGEETEMGFGPIETMILTRDMPRRAEGETGILSTTSERQEVAVLRVENLGEEAWPVRLMDVVPYSEQEDLEAHYEADPAPSETNVDGQRGILAWDFEIAPGETREVRLQTRLRWPEGMVLQ